MGLDQDIALRRTGEGEYEGNIVEHWWTPRGPLGGYVMAIVHRGMELAVDDAERQPRSLNVYFLRPPHAGRDHRAPRGRASGPLAHHGDGAAGAGRQADRARRRGVLLAVAGSVPVGGADAGRRPGRASAPPSAAACRPAASRPSWAGSRCSAASAIPPSANRSMPSPAAGSGLLEERPVDAATAARAGRCVVPGAVAAAEGAHARAHDRDGRDVPHARCRCPTHCVLGRFHSRLVRDGFFDEQGELWTPDGTLVAQSRQLALLIGGEA